MADDPLDAGCWLGVAPNRQDALVADQISPLYAIRRRQLGCLDVGECSGGAAGLLQQSDLGSRVLLDAPQEADNERQSGRIADFDFLGRAGAGGDPQDIVAISSDQVRLGDVRVRPRKLLRICNYFTISNFTHFSFALRRSSDAL